jgi:hypothetical protein
MKKLYLEKEKGHKKMDTIIGERRIPDGEYPDLKMWQVIAFSHFNNETFRHEIKMRVCGMWRENPRDHWTTGFTNTCTCQGDDFTWENEVAIGTYPNTVFEAMEELEELDRTKFQRLN